MYRVRCKTNSITSWVRDFTIINNIVIKPDGMVLIVNQSVPEDYVQQVKRSLQSGSGMDFPAVSGANPSTAAGSRGRSVRGFLYCCGYLLRPLKPGEGTGCEVSYGCHIGESFFKIHILFVFK